MKYAVLTVLMSCSPLVAFQGFYVGGSLGGHLAEGAQAGSGSALNIFNFGAVEDIYSYPVDVQHDLFDRGVTGMLYAGYGIGWRSIYLAAEGFVQFGYAKLQSEQVANEFFATPLTCTISSNTNAHINCGQVGIDLIPGWSPNSTTLLYGRIGVSAARASLETDSLNSGHLNSDSWSLLLFQPKSKTSTARRAGGGLETRLTPTLTLRGDYIFTNYGNRSLHGSRTGKSSSDNSLIVSNNTRLHFYDHAVMLGLSYRFCCQELICIDPCCATLAYQGGYLGGSLGGSALTASQSGNVVGNNSSSIILLNQSADAPSQLYNNQFQGMLFLGYGRPWRRAYLGGEVFASAAPHTSMDCTGKALLTITNSFISDTFSTSYDTSVKSSTWQYGFDLRPGVILTSFTLLYGRVGVSAAEIKADSNALFTGIIDTDNIIWSLPEDVSAHAWKAAFRIGLGVEQKLTSKLHLRADYVFTNYGIVSFNNTATGHDLLISGTTTLHNTLSSHLQNNAIVVGLSYHFR